MTSSFANQVVLITGAGSGLGRQLALTLAGEGAAIAAVDIRPEGLASLAGELEAVSRDWVRALSQEAGSRDAEHAAPAGRDGTAL